MACNWLKMTSSGDDIWPSGSTDLPTDKTKKNKKILDLKTALIETVLSALYSQRSPR